MRPHRMTDEHISRYIQHLHQEEYAPNTAQKYQRDLAAFAAWASDQPITRQSAAGWKEYLLAMGKSPVTVNAALAALHGFFSFMGWTECRVKYVKVQRRVFRDASRELTRAEYQRLLNAAQGNQRLAMVLQTICATGIRVSEARYITVEAARRGRAEIFLKGKARAILIPSKLGKKLLKYADGQGITSGEIFLTASGKSLSRRQIWGEMKRLCRAAGVAESKVFPHNLRHLFARAFYSACRDIVRLADVLGHASVDTTRIYLISTGMEHARLVERLGFVP